MSGEVLAIIVFIILIVGGAWFISWLLLGTGKFGSWFRRKP